MLRYYKIYSIDISIGAVVSTWFIAHVVSVALPWYIYVLIFITVWSVYSIDHLIDARKLNGQQGPDRYSLHLKYFVPILIILFSAVILGLVIVIRFLSVELIKAGFILTAAVLLYFFLRLFLKRIFSGLKELIAAVIYTAGVSLATFYYNDGINFYLYLVILQFFCLVFANLLVCSMWDENWDKTHSYDSMTVLLGRTFIKIIIVALIFISIVSSAIGIFIYTGHRFNIQLIILAMNVCLTSIYLFTENRDENIRRFLIDSIFFIPLILVLL